MLLIARSVVRICSRMSSGLLATFSDSRRTFGSRRTCASSGCCSIICRSMGLLSTTARIISGLEKRFCIKGLAIISRVMRCIAAGSFPRLPMSADMSGMSAPPPNGNVGMPGMVPPPPPPVVVGFVLLLLLAGGEGVARVGVAAAFAAEAPRDRTR